MYVGITIILCSAIYVLLTANNYFSKKRIGSVETRIYSCLLITCILCLIFEFLCILYVNVYQDFYWQSQVLNRCFLICILVWVALLTHYIFSITFINDIEKNKKKYKMFKFLYFLLITIFSIILIFLPLEFYSNDNNVYSFGLATNFLNYIVAGLTLVCLIMSIANYKFLKNKKYMPVFVFILFIIITIIVRNVNPALLLINATISFVTVLMYFTIENPDMKMINELNIAKDQAVKANAAKTDFLSSMSHEIRTPLNAIVGFSESLKEEQLSPEAKEEVGDIIDASSTLLEIVNGILDISKIEANKIEIVNSNYHFTKIFNELIALSKARLGDSKPIEFKYKMDESIPGTLYGDYARIKQVILNLLTNSIKYTDSGYIDFQVNSIINDNVCRLIVSVEDSGKGIKKESINKLFTKFERLDEKNTTIEGTGLGLAITKKLVELMNGKIVVQSIYGKGSKFTVIIDQRIIATEDTSIEEEKEEETNIIKQYPNKKLLIVDDNQLNLKVAARLLRSYECQIEEVDSGYKVLDLIASGNKYDLILMDDMMPKLSGIDTLHRLKENPAFNMPVVALTANAISGMREKYLAEGFDEYLAKPIEKNELNEIMLKFLDK